MQEVEGLVSVIIPAYNAAKFIRETIDSVKIQSYPAWEIIVVNDGSTDDTPILVGKETDPRIQMITQENGGVSSARNNGLQHAKGQYIVFFDADDLMTPEFLELRVNFLRGNPELGFTGGLIETFPEKTVLRKAAGENPEREILFFDTAYATLPSNYLFRKEVLLANRLAFNTNLSSTADRFFILQVSKVSKGLGMESEKGKLLYRVDNQSMSHNVTSRLILDNERFYRELVKEKMLPATNTRKFKSLYFYSLGLGFAKVKHFKLFLKYFWNSFISSPLYFSKLILKKAGFTK
jgi:glycosyltransferase involved in cell wall biosynthesis